MIFLSRIYCNYVPRFMYKEGFEKGEDPISIVGSIAVFLIGVVLIGLFLKKENKKGLVLTLIASAIILAVCNWHWASIIVWFLTLLIGWITFKANSKNN